MAKRERDIHSNQGDLKTLITGGLWWSYAESAPSLAQRQGCHRSASF